MDFSVSCTPLIVKLVCCLICATVKIIFQVITVSFDDVSFKLCVIQVDGENHKSVVIRGSSWGSEVQLFAFMVITLLTSDFCFVFQCYEVVSEVLYFA